MAITSVFSGNNSIYSDGWNDWQKYIGWNDWMQNHNTSNEILVEVESAEFSIPRISVQVLQWFWLGSCWKNAVTDVHLTYKHRCFVFNWNRYEVEDYLEPRWVWQSSELELLLLKLWETIEGQRSFSLYLKSKLLNLIWFFFKQFELLQLHQFIELIFKLFI